MVQRIQGQKIERGEVIEARYAGFGDYLISGDYGLVSNL